MLPVHMPALHAQASSFSITISVLLLYFLSFLKKYIFKMAVIHLTVARLHSEYINSFIPCAIFKGFLSAWFRCHLDKVWRVRSARSKEKTKQTNVDFKDPFI